MTSTDALIDSRYAWTRLAIALVICTIGGIGMWSVVVALPAVQAEFGVDRGIATLPYTLLMTGYALGGVLMGRFADRKGVAITIGGGAMFLGAGYILSGLSTSIWQFMLAHGVLIAFLGSSSTFGPLMADISFWFNKRRGVAVAVCASGNYLAGTIWPPVVQHFIETVGWRTTHIAIGIFCVMAMLPLAWFLRRRPPAHAPAATRARGAAPALVLGLSPTTVQALMAMAGFACCVAMATPQVHIVAYCGDLGYGARAGAVMLSLMLGFGIVSRLACGFIADRIGGMQTLLLSSFLQALALALYALFDGLAQLYVISAMFGLFQGGLIPSYAIVVREIFPPREAAVRVGTVLMATMMGMSIGGWMAGALFDLTGNYGAAFLTGLAWNVLNFAICAMLYTRHRRERLAGAPA
ncbi:MAG: MFS transporter [Alphaproteobacteria bacterium]|nr:MFS transporter [Alphaproteobacteria bacterium]